MDKVRNIGLFAILLIVCLSVNISKGEVDAEKENSGDKSDSTLMAFTPVVIPENAACEGFWIENRVQFQHFMIQQATYNKVEVAAFEVFDAYMNKKRYFIQPWDQNTNIRSYTNFAWVESYGYSFRDLRAEYHTHPTGTICSPSRHDAKMSRNYGVPVYAVSYDAIWVVEISAYGLIPMLPKGLSYGKKTKW